MALTRRNLLKASSAVIAASAVPVSSHAATLSAAGILGKTIVVDRSAKNAFPIVADGKATPVLCDPDDHKGVLRAIADLQHDIEDVTSISAQVLHGAAPASRLIIAGTLGKCRWIDDLVARGKLSVSDIKGRWESFLIATVRDASPLASEALVIVGSDKRGTIYGIYELSEQLGVSPWRWWADVPSRKRTEAFVEAGRYASGEPAVRYRGLFINDEAPCMAGWTYEKFGGFNSRMYTRMFELILRLRGNYLWPAMWDSAFNEDDPLNPALADEYGIVMGTSHHEPMMRSQQEWIRHHSDYGNGDWNYKDNAAGLQSFWRDGIRRNSAFENLVTIGMRGNGDLAMPTTGSMAGDIALLEKIMADQRQILTDEINPDITQVPQLWALFTEVQKFYDAGLKVPDDVTLLWTDDNVGNLRRVPTDAERGRKGGAGIYFHLDMHGGPYAYQWINTNPFPKIWEQMTLANEYGANRIWIANVGDLKPLELPLEFFIRMAWNPAAITRDKIMDYTLRWAARDFGEAHAAEIAGIVADYTKYNGWRKPEVVMPDTYSLSHYREAERVEAAWDDVIARAEALYAKLPQAQKDAYYQLVLHPAKASGIVTKLNIAAGRSQYFARQGRASANAQAALARQLFLQDQELSDYYNHQMAGGRWNHMMDQTHIGEFTWEPPQVNMLPPVSEILIADIDTFGVAIDGDQSAWPNHYGDAVLPVFESLNPRQSYFDVFARGRQKPAYSITKSADWIRLTPDETSGADQRYPVDIDWPSLPAGAAKGSITISGPQRDANAKPIHVEITVTAVKADESTRRQAKGRFASLDGPIAIAAAEATRTTAAKDARWAPVTDYGREAAAMSVVPVTAPSRLPPAEAPSLIYDLYVPRAGAYEVKLILGPVMDFMPDRGVRIAVAFDDDTPQVIDLFADRQAQTFLGAGWLQAARDNVRIASSSHTLHDGGRHQLKVVMVDPGVVVQKIIISDTPLPASYFGPPDMKPIFG